MSAFQYFYNLFVKTNNNKQTKNGSVSSRLLLVGISNVSEMCCMYVSCFIDQYHKLTDLAADSFALVEKCVE